MRRTRSLLASVLIAALATGCGSEPEPESISVAERESLSASAVGIEASGCSLRPSVGSGVVVGAEGVIITVAHTVAGADEITVIDREGRRLQARLRMLDPASDIAILTVEDLRAPGLALGSSADQGDEGQLLAWNGAEIEVKPMEIGRRLRVTIEDIYIEEEVERTAYELLGAIDSGDSGGGVVVDGALVAMVYARARRDATRGFALDEAELSAALDRYEDTEVDSERCVP